MHQLYHIQIKIGSHFSNLNEIKLKQRRILSTTLFYRGDLVVKCGEKEDNDNDKTHRALIASAEKVASHFLSPFLVFSMS